MPKVKEVLVAVRNILSGEAWLAISPVFAVQSWARCTSEVGSGLQPFFVAYRGANAVATGGIALTMVALQAAEFMKEQEVAPFPLEVPIPPQVVRRAGKVRLAVSCRPVAWGLSIQGGFQDRGSIHGVGQRGCRS